MLREQKQQLIIRQQRFGMLPLQIIIGIFIYQHQQVVQHI